jgi:hypothetical protein
MQVTNLLYKVDATISADLTCLNEVGGSCYLANPCSTYTNLWSAGWSFKIKFEGASNYINMPLGALAVEDTANGQCDIMIQYLHDT